MKIYLQWRNERQDEQQAYELDPQGIPLWIGRLQTCPVCLHDLSVSRKQAALSCLEGSVFLFVESENNPAFLLVDGVYRPIPRKKYAALEEGSHFLLGETYLTLSFLPPAARSPQMPPKEIHQAQPPEPPTKRMLRCHHCGTEQPYHLESFCVRCGYALASGVTVFQPHTPKKP